MFTSRTRLCQEVVDKVKDISGITSYAPRSVSPMMGTPATEIPCKDNTVSSGRFSNYRVIVHKVIMLVLGYIVYQDVSKRISRVEAKISAIEKKLNP